MNQKTKVIGEGVNELFPLVFSRCSYDGSLNSPIRFESFTEFTAFLKTFAGFYSVYRVGERVLIDKDVVNAGMFTVFQSNPIRR